ncbi:MAG: hypothetical protein JWO06_3881 [Bacteroidota bacterium]|nr:hypothetical protein [Bacteroidota bacterium]
MRSIALLICLFVSMIIAAQIPQNGLAKLSPRTKQYLLQLKNSDNNLNPLPDYVYKKTSSGVYMSGLVKVNAAVNASDFETLGIHVGTKAGKIWTVQIPADKVEQFTRLNGMDYIELDELVSMKLDSVRKLTHVDSVHDNSAFE